MFYLYELLRTLKTPHRDKSFDHRPLLTDVNDFSAYMASRLNCRVCRLNFTIELLDILVASNAMQTIVNELRHLIIYCFNCILRD